MYKDKSLAVIVPAYREEKQIGRVIETMPPFVDKLVIVDDCSPDATSEVVRQYQAKESRIVLIRHEVNQGVGGAIATGYKWARDNGIDIAVVMAGDGQMDPRDLSAIVDPVADGVTDYSKANRLFFKDSLKEIPRVRLVGNAILSLLTKIASGYWHIADSQTGYTALNRQVLETIDWDAMFKRYGMPNDLLVRLNVFNFRVRDVYIRPTYNVGEESKLKVRKVVFSISTLLLRLFVWRMKEKYIIRDFHPLVFFYLLGVAALAVSGGLFVRLCALWILNGYAPPMTALAWMFCSATALQSIFFAMWFDMEANKRLNA